MKQVFVKRGQIVLKEIEEPACKDNEIKIKVKASAISIGTELKTIQKFNQPLLKTVFQNRDKIKDLILKGTLKTSASVLKEGYPLGYSCAGEIIEIGKNITQFKIKDRIACGGQNYASHAQIVSVPKNLCVKIPENVSMQEASHTTIGAIAIQSIRRLDPKFGETIVVYGLGLLGNIISQILISIGCIVIGVGRDPSRSALSTTDITYLEDPITKVLEFTKNNNGADGVIIAASSRNKEIINNSMLMCRKKAKVVLVGDVPINIDRKEMFKKELDFLISTSYGPGRYDQFYEEQGNDYPLPYVRWTQNRNMQEFLRLVSKQKINIKKIIQKEYNFKDAPQAYEELLKNKEKPLSVIFIH
jgi:threonine dehydrogenase-like Zn-dependent dehydrogenase